MVNSDEKRIFFADYQNTMFFVLLLHLMQYVIDIHRIISNLNQNRFMIFQFFFYQVQILDRHVCTYVCSRFDFNLPVVKIARNCVTSHRWLKSEESVSKWWPKLMPFK